MSFASGSPSSVGSEINVTPLIDVLLVLLIIFMVIVPVLPRGLDSALPQPDKSTLPSQRNPAVLSVISGSSGVSYSINRQPLAATTLRSALAAMFSTRQNRTLFLQADKSLSYGQVAYAIGEAKAEGAETVAFLPVR